MIKEVKKYTDDDGRTVTAYIPFDEKSKHIVAYEGQVGIQTPMGVAPVRFPFPPSFTLKDCFDNFEETANTEVDRIIKEAEEKTKEDNLIMTPQQVQQASMGNGQTIQFPR